MTNRREFLKKSAMAVAAVAVAPILSASAEPCKPTNMKKIMLIDGGPRRNMNTAAMAEAKKAWRDAHWEEDLRKAREAGKRMAKADR